MRSEERIEDALTKKLIELGYTYNEAIKDKNSLNQNFRKHFEQINNVKLTNQEFEKLHNLIVKPDVFEASQILRTRQELERDEGEPIRFNLINTENWCSNIFEVARQVRMNTDNSNHRYDLVLLINGIPVAQIELKNYKTDAKKAMEQIVAYKNDKGNGYTNSLMCFIQLFVVSNESNTYYFANNADKFFKFDKNEQYLPVYKFADEKNKKIINLYDFAENFLAKCTFWETISRFIVLIATEKRLVLMRPYQVYAVKAIEKKVQSYNAESTDTNWNNGFIWHTTGSGKTLTSFKTATLIAKEKYVYKCIFVVDRKDLDSQTRDEFNKFQEDCVAENSSTKELIKKITSNLYEDKIIVTTIQKLSRALKNNPEQLKHLENQRIVFIFDECHRGQFGENHKAIKNFFKRAQLFGFTGTPIFKENSNSSKIEQNQKSKQTTETVFGKKLHSYTISKAIDDGNVLKFNYQQVENKTANKHKIIENILENHLRLTAETRFNAIFATASINDAIEYYDLFAKIQEQKIKEEPEFRKLKIACVFTAQKTGLAEELEQELEDLKINPEGKAKALQKIMNDYAQTYGGSYPLSDEGFDSYYQNLQKRIKRHNDFFENGKVSEQIDITIVVDMLLTGFDSKYLNTIYVDKELKNHGLIQAFSRTNRILNNSKQFGNVVDFRAQEDNVNDAIVLFSDTEDKAENSQLFWFAEPVAKVIANLQEKVDKLKLFAKAQGKELNAELPYTLEGDNARMDFLECFKAVQTESNKLNQYIDLTDKQTEQIEKILPRELQNKLKAGYLEIYQQLKNNPPKEKTEKARLADFDADLTLFSQMIDYDYIMRLLGEYVHNSKKAKYDLNQIKALIAGDSAFIEDKEFLNEFIEQIEKILKIGQQYSVEDIKSAFAEFKEGKQQAQITAIADKFGINAKAVQDFVTYTIEYHFDNNKLRDELFKPSHPNLSFSERNKMQQEFMKYLQPILLNKAGNKTIKFGVYEQC